MRTNRACPEGRPFALGARLVLSCMGYARNKSQEMAGEPIEDTGQDVCSTREAAERLGVSIRTVQLWSEAGVLRAWKTPGGHRRILLSSIDDLLRRRGGDLARRAEDGRYQILIVEDEPDFRRLFELHLGSWGLPIELHSVPSGFDALVRIGASRPDLLITDLRMPGIDGFEMIRSLQAFSRSSS